MTAVIDTHSLALNDKTGVTDDERMGAFVPYRRRNNWYGKCRFAVRQSNR